MRELFRDIDTTFMNALQKSFLSMTRTVLWNEPFSIEYGVTPEELFNEACRYEIAGILSEKLDLFCQNDADTRYRWSKKAMADYCKSLYVLSAQSSLSKILARENIKPVILKGMASAYYYRNPLLRHIGDIDFLILPEQFDVCCKLLEQNGYKKGIDAERHLAFEKQGVKYECHRYFSYNLTCANKKEDQFLYTGCRNCITRTVEGKEYYVLPDAEYGIVLLEHLKHHLVDGVGFRQIIDWVIYCDTILNDDLCNNTFLKMASECGLERLAKVMTRTAQMYLGLTNNINWCSDVEESVCTSLIEMIFTCNNFGFISENDANVHIIGNLVRKGFFISLNASALGHIKLAKKIVILRPVAWLYQLIRWSIKGIANLLHSDKHSLQSSKNWHKQKELLKQIGVES